MKTKNLNLAALLFLPATLLLSGCWTNPAVLKPATGEPSFVGGMVIVDSSTVKATVEAIDLTSREVILKFKDGTTTTNIVSPMVVNLDQVKAGDTVKAAIGSETAIFVVANGPLPAAGAGVMVQGAARGALPAGMMVATHDYSARVLQADRSYRLLTLKYADGSVQTLKIPLPFTLEHVKVGDDVVVRTTGKIVLQVTPKQP